MTKSAKKMIAHTYHHTKPFALESGAVLPQIDIRYHCSAPKPEGKKVLWICHALTANSNPMEWWDVLVGPDKCFDPKDYFIICANILGSCYGSTGPLSLHPQTGQPYYDDFPLVSVRDLVNAHELLRKHLGIAEVDIVIGGSVGGFQALEWCVSYPEVCKHLIVIACNARISPWGTAYNESQRMAILADPTYASREPEGGAKGLAAARSIALLSYRSYEGYRRSQAEPSQDCFEAERAASYQQYQGQKLCQRFDAYSYMALTRTLDTHNVGRGRGGVRAALQGVQAKTLCIGIQGDQLFPPREVRAIQQAIPGAHYASLHSYFGHDGFLLEWGAIQHIVHSFLIFSS